MAVYLIVAGDVFDGVFLCCLFSNEMSWMKSVTQLSESISEGFPVGMSVSPHVCVILDLILMSLFLR